MSKVSRGRWRADIAVCMHAWDTDFCQRRRRRRRFRRLRESDMLEKDGARGEERSGALDAMFVVALDSK